MAEVRQLSAGRRAQIARLIGRSVDRSSLWSLRGGARLGESLPIAVWNVDLQRAPGPLSGLADQTDRWHHQIVEELGQPMVARTIEGDTEALSEILLSASDLGEKVDAAIAWVDAHIDDSWTAQMLFVPRLLMHALWLKRPDEDRLYVIEAPTGTFAEKSEITVPEVIEKIRQRGDTWDKDAPAPPWPENF